MTKSNTIHNYRSTIQFASSVIFPQKIPTILTVILLLFVTDNHGTTAFISSSPFSPLKIGPTFTTTIISQPGNRILNNAPVIIGGVSVLPSSSNYKNRNISIKSSSGQNNNNNAEEDGIWYNVAFFLANSFSTSSTTSTDKDRKAVQLITLVRVIIPSILSGIAATFLFPGVALFLASIMNDAGVFAILSQDSSQFVQNFLTVSGLLFSILVGQTYAFLYTQQESVFYALFDEVTEAKSLLEQVALVCQGRAMYPRVLESISQYIENDLKQLQANPAELISCRPSDDPLENIMYMTSVGVPSSVYETVKSLRKARAARLGALQRKLPKIHMLLLWVLAIIELGSFPLLGAGTQTIGGYNILTVEGCLFGIMTFGIVMTLRVIGELYRPGGGAYNVDSVLSVMVKGLETELRERLSGKRYPSNFMSPSAQYDDIQLSQSQQNLLIDEASTIPGGRQVEESSLPMLRQGLNDEDLIRPAKRIMKWVKRKRNRKQNDNPV